MYIVFLVCTQYTKAALIANVHFEIVSNNNDISYVLPEMYQCNMQIHVYKFLLYPVIVIIYAILILAYI